MATGRRRTPVRANRNGEKTSSEEFDRTREAIIRAAAAVFSRDGFHAGTTKDIAAQVGLSQPSLYYYVGSKEVLLNELVLRLVADMTATLEVSRQSSNEPIVQFQTFIRAVARTIAKNVQLFDVYWAERHRLPKKTANQANTGEREFVAYTEELVRRLQAEGALDAGPPAVVAEAIIGMIMWMYRWFRRTGPLDADAVADVFLRLVCLDSAPAVRR
jgi:AcrR family transcriptional regulator